MFFIAQTYQGWNGFLGTRGSFMLDFVFAAMFAVVPLLAVSIYLVKVRRAYQLHKTMQVALGLILLVAVTAFELDMRFGGGWKDRAAPSPYWTTAGWNTVYTTLAVHLCFAIPTLFLWIFVIVQALRFFPNPVQPSAYSPRHLFWAWPATIGMTMTAVTGWIFYYTAFAA